MFSTIATWYLKPESQSEGIAALRQLAIDVEANEPDTWGYLIHSGAAGSAPPCSDDTIVFVEIYRDEQAFIGHVHGPVFTKFMKDHGDLFQAGPGGDSPFVQVQNVDRIQGFLRPEAGSGKG
ncbi:putative quinol monooxygenase [Ruegeria sp. Ofav3-42]|uniref:putative quinol monooxygenase n=1 Tax=Ruegeria sp. Ofav3-42 TaxID=2917759 RepID=UPI001EF3E316|nr:antibiotic biosynthesis monooxygenase [Ruegeria sp. Ofav3-42]MCG7521561.1 antibiotic biosynthesis monooxygenase [Ruegeria sp. Ofav3-42]